MQNLCEPNKFINCTFSEHVESMRMFSWILLENNVPPTDKKKIVDI